MGLLFNSEGNNNVVSIMQFNAVRLLYYVLFTLINYSDSLLCTPFYIFDLCKMYPIFLRRMVK